MTSIEVKDLIKKSGDTVESAAVKMGMSLQNLYKHLRKEPLSKTFILKFNEVYATGVNLVKEDGVPYYPIDVSASNVEIFNDNPEISTLKISIPGFEDCEMALPNFGHSMYPTYENGCIIMCKRIRDLDVIVYGEVHLIITAEQRLLKRIQKSDSEESILLTSDNDELRKDDKRKYEPFDIKKNKIRHLFLVKGSIKRNQI